MTTKISLKLNLSSRVTWNCTKIQKKLLEWPGKISTKNPEDHAGIKLTGLNFQRPQLIITRTIESVSLKIMIGNCH